MSDREHETEKAGGYGNELSVITDDSSDPFMLQSIGGST